MDAHDFKSNPFTQFQPMYIKRELNKALVAFEKQPYALPDAMISTGSWGCGVYCGDKELKFVIQWLAASAAQRNGMQYYVFGDTALGSKMQHFVSQAASCTVAQVFAILQQAEQIHDIVDNKSTMDMIIKMMKQ